jgi:hypothetical protein
MARPLLNALYAMQQPMITVRDLVEGDTGIDANARRTITTQLEAIAASLAAAWKEVKQPADNEAARRMIEKSLRTIATALTKAQEADETPEIDDDARNTIAEAMDAISVALGDALMAYNGKLFSRR